MLTSTSRLMTTNMESGLSAANPKTCSSFHLNAVFSNKQIYDKVNISAQKTLPVLGGVNLAPKPITQFTQSVIFKPKIRPRKAQGVQAQAASDADVGFEDSSVQLGSYQSQVLEFITSERAKVLAMVALGMSLCNADRVVLSVAIMPLASTHGWSSSFAGIVQCFFLFGIKQTVFLNRESDLQLFQNQACSARQECFIQDIVIRYSWIILPFVKLVTPERVMERNLEMIKDTSRTDEANLTATKWREAYISVDHIMDFEEILSWLNPVAGGALADRYGGKRVMAWGVAIWSLATLLTPWAANHSLGMLLAVRTLFGMAEGVALPCMNTMISRWFPCTERAKAVGLSMAGFHLGNVISLLASPIIMSQTGVFGPFVIFGFLGFLWLSVWTYAISNNPESHPGIAKSEVLYIQDGNKFSAKSTKKPLTEGGSILPPFRLLLSKLPTWAIIIANLTNNWGYFVLLSWMPVYFNTVFGINLKEAAWFSAIPWATMAAVGYVAGAFSDFLIQSGLNITLVRKIMQERIVLIHFVCISAMRPRYMRSRMHPSSCSISIYSSAIDFLDFAFLFYASLPQFFCPVFPISPPDIGVALLGLNAAQTPSIASAWLTVALGLSAFSQAGFLLNMQDIAPQYAGVLHGMTNTVGTMAAIVSTIGIGFFVQWLGSFQSFLTLTAVLYFASALWWDLFATGERDGRFCALHHDHGQMK
eukprot:Gb_28293 [translate_table: standard]